MGMRSQLTRQVSAAPAPAMPPVPEAQEFLHQAGKLVHRLFSPPGQAAPASVMFCGIDRASGCSTICFRTAEILAAQKRGTVCLVDANLRAPSLHRHFRIENRAGFSDSLIKSDSMQGLAQQIQGSKLWVVTSGTAPDVSLAVHSERLQSQILTLR